MDLVVNKNVIEAPIETILIQLRKELNKGLLKDIRQVSEQDIAITCPFHKDGHEQHPSCNVFTEKKDKKLQYGLVHCFTCGYSATLPKFVADCFDKDLSFGESWLCNHFGSLIVDEDEYLQPITFNTKARDKKYLDESILNQYMYYNDYMWKRGLSREVVDRFGVGYDKKSNSIVFPVWDERDGLVMITSRNIGTKFFHIPKDADKPIYLLNFMLKDNVNTLYVCESQINALTLQSWGYPGVALFGTGSENQYPILNKCGIRNFVLCFDGDSAGDKGIERFRKNIHKDCFVSYKKLPRGKDVNDLTKDEFEKLQEIYL